MPNSWISDDIIKLIYKRNYFHKVAIRSKNEYLWKKYRLLRNKITQAVRQAKTDYYKTKISSANNDPRKMWKVLKQALPSNKHSSQSCKISAQTFNDFFSSVGVKLATNFGDLDLPEVTINTPHELFNFVSVDVNFVLHELLHLSPDPKMDVLNFDCKLLRIASPIIAPILTHIYNLSLCFGSIPSDLKLACITPIYKGKGDNENPTNYRPISIVSPLAKILEKTVKLQLVTYLNSHNLISSSQSAYLKNHSTVTALHNLTDYLYSNINAGKVCISCFLDISKGFDSLNTDILIQKLTSHGVSDSSISWFKSYLTGRNQIVKFNNISSQTNTVRLGVPQGTVLGPILFLIYVNDLSAFVKDVFITMYADDSSIVATGNSVAEASSNLNISLNKISQWFTRNRLLINASKSNVMVIGIRNTTNHAQELNIKFDNNILQKVQHTKLLGIVIDENLSFNKHIDHLIKKISPKIAVLHRLRYRLPVSSLNQIYLAIVQSTFDYCLSVWGNTSKQNLKAIQCLQNRAARAVTGIFDYNYSVSKIINDLSWMNIKQRFSYFLNSCIQMS